MTHEHLDHLGLVQAVARRSGARIACLDRLAPYAADVAGSPAADRSVRARPHAPARRRPRRRRSDPRALEPERETCRSKPMFCSSQERDRAPRPPLHVIHAPGHSATDTLFHDERNGILFVGDHLLPTISSNALVASRGYPASGGERHARGDVRSSNTLASLAVTRDLDVDDRSHRPWSADHEPPRAYRRACATHSTRAAKIVDALATSLGRRTKSPPELWGPVAVAQPYLTLSEVLGHVDLLVDAGLAVESADDELHAAGQTSWLIYGILYHIVVCTRTATRPTKTEEAVRWNSR